MSSGTSSSTSAQTTSTWIAARAQNPGLSRIGIDLHRHAYRAGTDDETLLNYVRWKFDLDKKSGQGYGLLTPADREEIRRYYAPSNARAFGIDQRVAADLFSSTADGAAEPWLTDFLVERLLSAESGTVGYKVFALRRRARQMRNRIARAPAKTARLLREMRRRRTEGGRRRDR